MYEKVNPSHPDKVADRIAGALVDLAYAKQENPKVAIEVLIGHGKCEIIGECSVSFTGEEVSQLVTRISGEILTVTTLIVPQDKILASNQEEEVRCGDNGIFKGVFLSDEERGLAALARKIYSEIPFDGKYIYDLKGKRLIICQSNAEKEKIRRVVGRDCEINPLGDWFGGTGVDAGATNRKLGSDMARGVTGGGLHGKDLSKADVSVNIWCHLEAQRTGEPVEVCCAIGDTHINGIPYSEIVKIARGYIERRGGFEKFAEWGLV